MTKWFCFTLFALPLLAQEPVRYELKFPNAAHHEAEVRATFSGVRQPVLEVLMSRSSPGRYALHEFAKNVYHFQATDGQGHALEVTQPSPYQWNVTGHKGTVVVEYTVFGDRADGTYNGIDPTHAHLNLPATVVWAHGFEKAPVSLKFELPAGSDWKIATQLAQHDDGTWTAPNMDRMMDSPVEISHYYMAEWKVGGSQFRMALHHRGTDEEAAAFARLCQVVVTEEEGVFGAFPKYDNGNYTFLLDYLPYASGDGMEHRNSTVIAGTRDLKDAAAQMIGTVSHEFFHSWNVKRIRPKTLEPFDFERADMSGELWFAEGFTNYYGPLTLKRAGLMDVDRFARSMGGAVSTVLNAPGRLVFNVIDMSRRAPFVDAATANDPVNTGNTFISYYTYGQALALGIDLSIRTRFPGKTLDDWMRAMWREHPDTQKPYTLDDLQRTLGEVTSKEFAGDIFQRHIYGKEPMDYEKLLARAGLLLEKRTGAAARSYLGAQGLWTDRGMEIAAPTLIGSPFYNAGIDRGDIITDWDRGAPRTQRDLDALLEKHKAGDKIHLKVDSRGGKKEVDITLADSPAMQLVPYELADKQLTPEMTAFREAWLSSKAVHPLPKVMKYCPLCRRSHPFEFDNCPYDGTALRITALKPGEEYIPDTPGGRGAPAAAPATGGRGGRRGGGGQ
ncbi:Peptidase M61 domain-containing protein [Candidatus Sulfopaludibacter sp. SbA3]|nr:Peptidase M61 domain-containing protein [Candidatus Sulfopaludibacter sp. SbA3]